MFSRTKPLPSFAPRADRARMPRVGGWPQRVVLLRHAEKPSDDADPHLSARGGERAAALALRIPHQYSAPRFLFASARSHEGNRPVETLTPLASALKLDEITHGAGDAASITRTPQKLLFGDSPHA